MQCCQWGYFDSCEDVFDVERDGLRCGMVALVAAIKELAFLLYLFSLSHTVHVFLRRKVCSKIEQVLCTYPYLQVRKLPVCLLVMIFLPHSSNCRQYISLSPRKLN